ncbi:MAG TPA: TIGR04255 family protein [Myxococcales bacterium]
MKRRIYAKPPIVEAVIEMRFDGGRPWDQLLAARLQEAFKGTYPGEPRRTTRFEVQAKFEAESVSTATRAGFHKLLLPSKDGTQLVGVGDSILSMHVLAPYPGWEKFIAATEDVLSTYREIAAPEQVLVIGIRYIDQIALPQDPNLAVSDYFPSVPARPRSMPAQLTAFHLVTEANDSTKGVVTLLTLASAPPTKEGRPVVLYDLNLIQTFPNPLPLDSWKPPLEKLHERQRDIFEESITDQTRELFV